MLSRFICVWLFAVLWTIACQSLSMGLPRQECWSGLPCHAPGDFPWSKLVFLMPPALAGGFFTQLRNHILLSERSQPEKFTYCLIPTIWHFGKGTELLDGHKKELLHGSILVEACGLENNWRWALFSCTFIWLFKFCGSVAKSCLTFCNTMDCSMPGLPVLYHLLEFAHSVPVNLWCRPTISSSVVHFSSCLLSFPALGSFLLFIYFF